MDDEKDAWTRKRDEVKERERGQRRSTEAGGEKRDIQGVRRE